MKIETYSYDLIDSKMYLLLEGNEAIVIDPFETGQILEDFPDIRIQKVLLTHEHYDHISGVNWVKKMYGSEVICSEACARNLTSPIRNGSKYFNVLFIDKAQDIKALANQVRPMTCEADFTFKDEWQFLWNKHKIKMKATPGHSEGSSCIIVDDKVLFTGDSLLNGIPVITRLPGGNKRDYEHITLKYFNELDTQLQVYPGHGKGATLKEVLQIGI